MDVGVVLRWVGMTSDRPRKCRRTIQERGHQIQVSQANVRVACLSASSSLLRTGAL